MTRFISLFLKILVTIPVIAFLFFLTITNREQMLNLTWSPLSDATEISLPIVMFVCVVAGFVWGSLILWSNSLSFRAEHRAAKKQIATLERQLSVQSAEIERLSRGQSTRQAEFVKPPTPRIATPEIL